MTKNFFQYKKPNCHFETINCQMHSTKSENFVEVILQNRDFNRIKLNLP
jgi:hypothetical protein